MKKIVFWVLLALLQSTICLADPILHLDFTFYKNETANLERVYLSEGIPTKAILPGEYRVQIASFNGTILYVQNMSVHFMILTDPPTIMDSSEVLLKIPFNPEMKQLGIYKGNTTILLSEIVLCNNDSICQTDYENYLSCPKDCPLNKEDKFCIKSKDGICDPDCYEGIDADCIKRPSQPENNYAILVLGMTIILIGLYLAIRKPWRK
jgi:hypothetical protein